MSTRLLCGKWDRSRDRFRTLWNVWFLLWDSGYKCISVGFNSKLSSFLENLQWRYLSSICQTWAIQPSRIPGRSRKNQTLVETAIPSKFKSKQLKNSNELVYMPPKKIRFLEYSFLILGTQIKDGRLFKGLGCAVFGLCTAVRGLCELQRNFFQTKATYDKRRLIWRHFEGHRRPTPLCTKHTINCKNTRHTDKGQDLFSVQITICY